MSNKPDHANYQQMQFLLPLYCSIKTYLYDILEHFPPANY